MNWYQFTHWAFKWVQDSEGDIGFQMFGIITAIKYKEHTIWKFGRTNYDDAPKYVIDARYKNVI